MRKYNALHNALECSFDLLLYIIIHYKLQIKIPSSGNKVNTILSINFFLSWLIPNHHCLLGSFITT